MRDLESEVKPGAEVATRVVNTVDYERRMANVLASLVVEPGVVYWVTVRYEIDLGAPRVTVHAMNATKDVTAALEVTDEGALGAVANALRAVMIANENAVNDALKHAIARTLVNTFVFGGDTPIAEN